MTKTPTATTAPAPSPGAGDTLLARIAGREPRALAIVALPALAFFAMFYRWFLTQHSMSIGAVEDWGHAYIVPLVGLFYIWTKRREIVRTPDSVYWPGLAVAVLGVVTYLYFVLAFPNHMFQGFALVLTVAGLVLLVAGTRVFGVLFFPVAYLALGVTISDQIMTLVTWPLKQFAAVGGDILLQMLTLETQRAANVIYVLPSDPDKAPVPLNIEEACSGMRMVIAFIALGAAVAFLSCRFWWQRIALLLLTLPVALGMNIVRIAALGVVGLIDPELAGGDSHAIIGMILLFPSLAIFMGCVWLLNKAVVEVSEPAPDTIKGAPS
ncbi:MAG: exosortase/archaeosortase family protein [Planctomycetota bacterium]